MTGKVGFDNFGVTNATPPAGFTNSVGLAVARPISRLYPGGGMEAFAGPIGLRAEIGDDIFFNGGAHNNMRVTLVRSSASRECRSYGWLTCASLPAATMLPARHGKFRRFPKFLSTHFLM